MSERRLVAGTWGACVVLVLGTALLLVLAAGTHTATDDTGFGGYAGAAFAFAAIVFASVGATVARRVPGNVIGRLLLLMGVLLAIGDFALQYADRAVLIVPGALPGGTVAAWLQNVALTPCLGFLGVILLLFPDGRLPSRRWRPVLVLALAGMALVAAGYALRPGPLDAPFKIVVNPVGVGSFGLWDTVSGLGWLAMGPSVALSALAMVLRLRRSTGAERQQLKWIALAAAIAGAIIVADICSYFASVSGIDKPRDALLALGFSLLPLAAGAAILRYRLYDIDVVINRTVVYGALTATLAAVYAGTVLLLQLALSGLTAGSNLAVAISTLAVAALFRPARSRIQGTVDRRFYRRKYDAQRMLDRFAGRVRDEVGLDALTTELRGVVGETMQPAHVSLWLREAER